MGNEPSKRSGGSKRSSANGALRQRLNEVSASTYRCFPLLTSASFVGSHPSADKKSNAVPSGAKHVQISPETIKVDNDKAKRNKKQLRMDESAHTFAPSVASSSSAQYGRHSTVMITDALGDVRTNYHIDPKELGHGHYGVVRKCMHRESGEWYAIKSIRKSKVSKIEVLKREVEILKEVKHPHIIELIEVYEDERYLHLITELCTGGELFDRIIAKTQSDEGHFSEKDAAGLVRDILDAIRYCHDEKGICHRDLKPENFLFLTEAEDAPVKIIDFGLSRHDDTELGIMQTKVGTPYYGEVSISLFFKCLY
jgi:Protein kinase domain